jgi:prepilin-type N-terminal cleavage/methylation domain-containing protein
MLHDTATISKLRAAEADGPRAAKTLKPSARRVDPRAMWRSLRVRACSQSGFTLIEVLVSALIVTLIAGAVAGGLMANIRATADQHRRTVAQALAEQDQERLKGLSSEQLDNLSQTYNTTFDNYKFQVSSKSWYLSSTNGQACSSSGSASATYFKTISTVSWTNPSGVTQSLATDESVISPPAGGGILAQFHDQTLSPLSGVAVSASGPDSDAATSDANGCVIFSALPTGNYNLTFTDSQYVDPNGNASPISATASVASTGYAAPSDGNPVELGSGGGVTGSYAVEYGNQPYPSTKAVGLSWLSPGGAGIPMAKYRTYGTTLSQTFQTYTASGTGSTQGLFPFVSSLNPVSYASNYQLWAGRCLQEQPPAGYNVFSVAPGASLSTQTVVVPALVLTTTYQATRNGTAAPEQPTDVKVTFTSASGTSCTDEWALTSPAATGPSNSYVYGIPYANGQTGSDSVCVDYKVGSSTYYQTTLGLPGGATSYTSPASLSAPLTYQSQQGPCT